MLTALWNLSAAIRGYLRFYMPTNRAVDWLRTPRGLKWAIPVALVATPAYLAMTALAIQLAARPASAASTCWCSCSSGTPRKFAWMAVLSPLLLLGTSSAAVLLPQGREVNSQWIRLTRAEARGEVPSRCRSPSGR